MFASVESWRTAQGRWRLAVAVTVGLLLAVVAAYVLDGLLGSSTTYGIHDWDSHTAHRYIPILALKRYHEGPWWAPWFAGGYPAWGYSESATSLISPFFPAYFFLSMPLALRVEVAGTALLALAGAFVLARRFTSSLALAALTAVLFAFNGRWALQMASGHAWHLQYAYLPWALFFFDRALGHAPADRARRFRDAALAGATIALVVYAGGIYPLPHAGLVVGVFALLRAASDRTLRPIGALAVTGVYAVALSAPKLFPVIDTMRRFPRLIPSTEALELRQLPYLFASPTESFGETPVGVGGLAYGYHEFGIYVGALGLLVLGLAVFRWRSRRGWPIWVLGVLFAFLGMGAFADDAPWTLLHKMPVFASQHVPSRFLYVAVLLLAVSFCASAERLVFTRLRSHPWLDLVLLVPVAFVAFDIARTSRHIAADAFTQVKPPIEESATFFHREHPLVNYPHPDWAAPVYLGILSNVGIMDSWAVPRDFPKGAIVKDGPGYRGEAYLDDGHGTAEVRAWTPSSATVAYRNATPGAVLIYNMNFDPSWKANGAPAIEWKNAVATRVTAPDGVVTFRYRPRSLLAGVVLAIGALVFPFARDRSARRRPSPPRP